MAIVRASNAPKMSCIYTHYRLPHGFDPIQYDLTLSMGLERPWGVYGEEIAHISTSNAVRGTKCLVMHTADMTVFTAEASNDEGASWFPLMFRQEVQQQQLLVEAVEAGRNFSAPIIQVRLTFGYAL